MTPTKYRDSRGRFAPRTDMSKMPRAARSDAIFGSPREIQKQLRNSQLAFGSGWLYPQIAWATYAQNGVLRHVIGRFATLMTSKPWSYQGTDVKYEWSTVLSKLETLNLAPSLRSAVIWMMIFGGAGIVLDVDDGYQTWSEPLDETKLRAFNKLVPKTALSLKPYPFDQNWETCEYFYDQYTDNDAKRLIHRSRVLPIVAHDTPPDLGRWGSQVYNHYTGWPPSWIEGVYDSLCEWKGADKNVGTIIKSMRLLYLRLTGLRKAQTAPKNAAEVAELEDMLDQLAEALDNESMLYIDREDELGVVNTNANGLDRLLAQKKGSFVAATGVPKELVLMEAVGNLGDNSGPIDAYNQYVDGWRTDILIAPVTRVTDLQLKLEQRADPTTKIPKQYTVKFAPLSEQSGKEMAEQRDKEASARERDLKLGVDPEVIQSDPSLNIYPGMPRWREAQAEKAEVARAAAAAAAADPMASGELESAASIARRLGIKRSTTVIALANRGEIEGRKIAGRWKFHWPTVWNALKGSKGEEIQEEIEQLEVAVDRRDAGVLGLSEATSFGTVFGRSAAMREIFAVLERVAPTRMPVLISGETGTGKEGIARGLYDASGQRGRFVSINCGALPLEPDRVLEELTARVKEASSGTLFLDEIGELPQSSQAAMLRVLAEADGVRLISATWRDLKPPTFRRDLQVRLAQVEVEVPPLRDREDDVFELAQIFYQAWTRAAGFAELKAPFATDALSAMAVHQWPGNVRELKNAVERGALFAGESVQITAAHLSLPIGR